MGIGVVEKAVMAWRRVRDGRDLPQVGQRILYVEDVRGTRDEMIRKLPGDMKIEFEPGRFIDLAGPPRPLVEVRAGEVGRIYPPDEDYPFWGIEIKRESWQNSAPNVEHVTLWAPWPSPPEVHA